MPGRRRLAGWAPVLATATVAGLTQVFWLSYSPVATGAAGYYGVGSGAIAALNLVYPALYVVLAIPAGRWLDRAPRPALLVGAILTAAGAAIRIVGESYGAALAGQVVISVAQPILLNGLIVVARAHLPPSQRPAGIAAGSVGFFLGVLVGYTMPVLLVDGTDLGTLLAVQAALGLAGGAWMAWAVRRTEAPALADAVGGGALRRVLRDPGVRVLAVLAFGGFGLFGSLLAGIQPLLEPRGIAADTADLLIDVMVLAGLLVAAFVPPWAARRGRRRPTLLAALVLASAAMALAAIDLPVGVLAILLALMGAMLVPALPILLEIAEQRLPELSGTVAAVIWLAGNLGVGVLAAIASLLSASPAAAFLMLAAAGAATVAFARGRLTPEVAMDRPAVVTDRPG